MATKTKTWKVDDNQTQSTWPITQATPETKWIAYLQYGYTIHVAQAKIYWGVKGWREVVTVNGEMINCELVMGHYDSRADAESRADELVSDGWCGKSVTRG